MTYAPTASWLCKAVLKHSFLRHLHISNQMGTLETLKFDNLALRRLPIDSEERNYVRTVRNACFSRVKPSPVDDPVMVAYSPQAMSLIDLPGHELEREEAAKYFSGNLLLPGSDPAAHCYCGHQFGYFTGQLGDGAAMYLGEIVNAKGERWEIQLKGAGLTPYSRTADGRKVMRSSIREFLCSEAMHFLNIPTTRAACCVTSETEVIRDIFYDGHPRKEKCTIVLRIAPTFLRFGSFEICNTMDPTTRRCGPSVGNTDILVQLLDYTIETFFPHVQRDFEKCREEKYSKFFEEVVLSTARLVAEWQCVGFCHGVLNTDNMSIVGVTIDYGPFGFMDMFNPDHICNASDDGGRYSYIRQPQMCLWNLRKLAESLESVLPLPVSGKSLELFEPEFNSHYMKKMRCKLGLFKELPEDSALVESLFETMEKTGSDFTNTFRSLKCLLVPGIEGHDDSLKAMKFFMVEICYPLNVVVDNIKNSMSSSNVQLFLALSKTNPELAQRFHSSYLDLERIRKKTEWAETLSDMNPFSKRLADRELWSEWIDTYAARLTKEYEDKTCSPEDFQKRRIEVMNRTNPRFVLRNHILQNVITKAEAGNYTEVKNILKQLETPFDDPVDDKRNFCFSDSFYDPEDEADDPSIYLFYDRFNQLDQLPPESALHLKVT